MRFRKAGSFGHVNFDHYDYPFFLLACACAAALSNSAETIGCSMALSPAAICVEINPYWVISSSLHSPLPNPLPAVIEEIRGNARA